MSAKYLLKERNDRSTDTLHIYEGVDDMQVVCGKDSLSSVAFKDYLKTRSLEDMRIHIAKIAHTTNICSICISHLYKSEGNKKPTYHLYECHKGKLCLDQENLNSKICTHGSNEEYIKAPNIKEIRQECALEANNRVNICGKCVARIYKNSHQGSRETPPIVKKSIKVEGDAKYVDQILEFIQTLPDNIEVTEGSS